MEAVSKYQILERQPKRKAEFLKEYEFFGCGLDNEPPRGKTRGIKPDFRTGEDTC
jgi:hypothetical protein